VLSAARLQTDKYYFFVDSTGFYRYIPRKLNNLTGDEKLMKKLLFLLALCGLTAACTTNPDGSSLSGSDVTGLEYYNRSVFNFNYKLQKNVFNPVARGYKGVTNQFFRDRVTLFFNNLEEPVFAVNNLFQGEFKDSGVSIGRFAVNSTLGLAGLFDVAKGWGLEKKKRDFDGTLAKYCVPDGPFFVLPVLGPATPRYIVGWGADSFASPMYWALIDVDDKSVDYVVYGAVGLKYLNYYAENMQILDALEAGSVDFYTAVKSAFLQNRQKYESLCQRVTEEEAAPNYDFDFEEDDNE
jgi:phospholipid-binding lipoprotein MlaA